MQPPGATIRTTATPMRITLPTLLEIGICSLLAYLHVLSFSFVHLIWSVRDTVNILLRFQEPSKKYAGFAEWLAFDCPGTHVVA